MVRSGAGNVAPAPKSETDAVGCHADAEVVAEGIVVAELIVSEVIIDCSVVAVMDEDSDIVEICCMLVV